MTVYRRGNSPKKSGSILVAVMMVMIVLTTVTTSFMQLALHEKKMAARSFEKYSLMNLAEAGLEDAIWAVKHNDWTDWESFNSGKDRYKPLREFTLGNGTTSQVHSIVQNVATSPVVYTEAIARSANGNQIKKQLRVQFSADGGSDGGFISKGKVDLSGQTKFDSYDSRKGLPDSFHNRTDKVTVASVSKDSDALTLSSDVDIYGYAGTGQQLPYISGSNNKIRGESSPYGNIDWSRVYQDFTFDFPQVVEPSWSGAATKLPPKKDGFITLGMWSGSMTKYKVDKLDLSGENVRVVGPVQIHLKDGMSISGGAFIQIDDGGSIEIFSPKDFTFSGHAIANHTNRPGNFKVFGTATQPNDQTLSLSGEGLIQAVFYMPYGKVNISGTGDFAGSLIANESTVSGQGTFHYDVSLGGSGGVEAQSISGWAELTKTKHQMDFQVYLGKG